MRIIKIAGIIIAFLLITTIVACGVFFSPQKGHENPLDDLNPVGLVINFLATLVSTTEVNLTWDLPATDQVPDDLELIVVRKEGSVPTSRGDGTTLEGVDVTALSHTDTVDANRTYWYAAWSYSSELDQYTGTVSASVASIGPVTNLAAVATSTSSIRITWDVATPAPGGIYIVRKVGSNPINRDDGTYISATYSNGELIDDPVGAGNVYHYAAWAHDAAQTTFTTAVYDTAETNFGWLKIYPSIDGWVNGYLNKDFSSTDLIISGPTSSSKYYSLFKFNLPAGPGASGYLSVYPYGGATSLTAFLNRIVQDWDENEAAGTLFPKVQNDSAFVDSEGFTDTMFPNQYRKIWLDNAVLAWASGSPNYGLRMRYPTNSGDLYFWSSEYLGTSQDPHLAIYISQEFIAP